MAFLQVDLSASSGLVRDSFKELAHVNPDVANDDVIIVALTQTELAERLRHIQLLASARDAEVSFPAEMREIDPATIINGKPLSEHFADIKSAA